MFLVHMSSLVNLARLLRSPSNVLDDEVPLAEPVDGLLRLLFSAVTPILSNAHPDRADIAHRLRSLGRGREDTMGYRR